MQSKTKENNGKNTNTVRMLTISLNIYLFDKLYNTIQYNTVNTIQYNTLQYNTIQYKEFTNWDPERSLLDLSKSVSNANNWDRYKASRNKVRSEFRLARYEYEKGLASQIQGDNKQFWKYVRSKTKTVTKVNRLKVPDGTLTTNDSETANVLNVFCKCI